ncbi:hypothetical protein [Longimicrobium sp.]|nr:hypothetical protein [Longimicrobium sp.]HEX6040183.1 hypothetical protein [Longimicrobium sp.]
MLKLSADDVTVESFHTQDGDIVMLPTLDEPTPGTRCGWCPAATSDCV